MRRIGIVAALALLASAALADAPHDCMDSGAWPHDQHTDYPDRCTQAALAGFSWQPGVICHHDPEIPAVGSVEVGVEGTCYPAACLYAKVTCPRGGWLMPLTVVTAYTPLVAGASCERVNLGINRWGARCTSAAGVVQTNPCP